MIDAIVKYRLEEDEKAKEKAEKQRLESEEDEMLAGDGEQKLKYFKTIDDLSEIEEWESLPDSEEKQRFLAMLTTKSTVFTIHLAALNKRNEEGTALHVDTCARARRAPTRRRRQHDADPRARCVAPKVCASSSSSSPMA